VYCLESHVMLGSYIYHVGRASASREEISNIMVEDGVLDSESPAWER